MDAFRRFLHEFCKSFVFLTRVVWWQCYFW